MSFVLPDTDSDPVLTVVMWPDASIGDPPPAPSPAPMLTFRSTYLIAIGVCGELPWTYSDLFGSNSYESPDDEGYLGPFFFLPIDWLCDYEVPEDER